MRDFSMCFHHVISYQRKEAEKILGWSLAKNRIRLLERVTGGAFQHSIPFTADSNTTFASSILQTT